MFYLHIASAPSQPGNIKVQMMLSDYRILKPAIHVTIQEISCKQGKSQLLNKVYHKSHSRSASRNISSVIGCVSPWNTKEELREAVSL